MRLFRLVGAIAIVVLSAGLAQADLNSYLERLSISADANFDEFRASLGAHFGASGAELDHAFLAVGQPSEAALCVWLSKISGHPMDTVLQQYRAHRKQGWGALAQSLGIKPGSAEFKALKAGQIGWEPPGGHGKIKGTDKDKKLQDGNAPMMDHSSKGSGNKHNGDHGNGKKP